MSAPNTIVPERTRPCVVLKRFGEVTVPFRLCERIREARELARSGRHPPCARRADVVLAKVDRLPALLDDFLLAEFDHTGRCIYSERIGYLGEEAEP